MSPRENSRDSTHVSLHILRTYVHLFTSRLASALRLLPSQTLNSRRRLTPCSSFSAHRHSVRRARCSPRLYLCASAVRNRSRRRLAFPRCEIIPLVFACLWYDPVGCCFVSFHEFLCFGISMRVSLLWLGIPQRKCVVFDHQSRECVSCVCVYIYGQLQHCLDGADMQCDVLIFYFC